MNNKKMFFLLFIIFIALLAGGAYTWWLYNQKETLAISLDLTKKTQTEMKTDAKRLEGENENLQKQMDKIQANALAYVAANTKLQVEKESLQKRIDDIEKEVKKKEALLEGVKAETPQAQAPEVAKLQDEIARLTSENKAAQEKLKGMQVEKDLSSNDDQLEKARLYYNLGVAYSQGKLYDEAIAAFERSLKYNPANSPAHYNMGLIFENIKLDPQKAAWHYKMYLEQSPEAQDREEVASWIAKLR